MDREWRGFHKGATAMQKGEDQSGCFPNSSRRGGWMATCKSVHHVQQPAQDEHSPQRKV